MTVSAADVLRGQYTAIKALGAKSINSDAYLEIEGYEQLGLLTKQFPWPTISIAGEIAVPGPLGTESFQPQQLKFNQQGQITFSETITGEAQRFLGSIIRTGGIFQCTVYEGTPDRFYRALKIRDCFVQVDPVDRDWENRSQVTQLNGTLFYHFFGEEIPGNIV